MEYEILERVQNLDLSAECLGLQRSMFLYLKSLTSAILSSKLSQLSSEYLDKLANLSNPIP